MKQVRTEIKWAIIFVLMQLLWMLMERLTGLHDVNIDKHATFTNLIAIPAVIVYLLALLDKRKRDYNGKMSYKQGVISGLIITAVVTILSPVSQAITSLVITPEYFNNIIQYTVDNGKMSLEMAEEYFTLKNYIIQGLMYTPVMGIVTTLIVAIFTIRKRAANL